MAAEAWSDWHTGVCDCFEDASTCCYGFWCCPCLACTVSSRFGENSCLPFCDAISLSLSAALGIPLFGPSPAALALRASIRNRYKIKGSLCKDIATSCFCVCCSWCQMLRELNHRRNKPSVINIVSMQPAAATQPNPVIHTYPLQTHTDPLQPHINPLQPHTDPLQPHTYPLQPHTYPLQPHTYPLQPHTYPLQTHTYPLQTHTYPLQTHTYPLQTHTYPLHTHTYPLHTGGAVAPH